MPDKNTAQPVLLWTNNHGYLQAWKSRPIKRDYDHILKTLLTNYLEPRQPDGCKLKTAPVRPGVAARSAE
ncbi:hypothetical protein, partial [Shigella flexneri]|uniref:hypothetical protein n=1 Tax=Shigella flexneri TaxID=623 RepID=UPI001C0A8AFF